MKKIFAIMTASVLAVSANAQTGEVGVFDPDALGVGSTAVVLDAGTVLAKTNSVTCTNAFKDAGEKKAATKVKNEVSIIFDGQELSVTTGIQGGSNGTKPAIAEWSNYKPTSGWVNKFEIGAIDSWGELYVAAKITGNKNYFVYEENEAGDFHPVPFWIIIDNATNGVCYFTPYDQGVDESSWSLSDYNKATATPDTYFKSDSHKAQGGSFTTEKANGTGVVCFDVFPKCKYYVYASGSKITSAGYYYVNKAVCKNITIKESDGTFRGLVKNSEISWDGSYDASAVQ